MIYNVRVSLECEFDDVEADSELEAAEIAKDLAVAAGGWACTVRPKEVEGMSGYIERSVLMREFSDFVRRANNSDFAPTPTWNDAVSLVGSCPDAEVEPVLRCKDCYWWTKQSDSLQGRCALFGMYPTGEWYCANARKPNPEEEDEQ